MKKTLLGMTCVMGILSGTAQAQSSVTLYGTIDTGVGFQSWKNRSLGVKESQVGTYNGVWESSIWGLKGSEDLGGGNSANFQLEGGFNAYDGKSSSDRLFKKATVGLANTQWGSIKFGRVGNVVQEYASFIAGPDDEENLADITNTFSAAGSNKADNTVVYKSPTIHGMDFAIGYSFNTNGPQSWKNKENVKLITTAMGYSQGPLTLGVGYDRLQSGSWDKDVHSWVAVGAYDFEAVLLGMAVGQDINGRQSALSSYVPNSAFKTWNSGYTRDFKTSSFTINATVPVGAVSSAMVGWSISRASSGFSNAYNLEKRQQNIYSAGYSYNLSKRTSLYAIGAYSTGFAFQNVRGQQVIVGLDHSF
ncbi:porin [Bordetella avium]|uniref:porin n=1 Tax=Bordetella avium TaxID=521 RepID=UPI000FD8DE5F|nr:porin [Bordetella avium]